MALGQASSRTTGSNSLWVVIALALDREDMPALALSFGLDLLCRVLRILLRDPPCQAQGSLRSICDRLRLIFVILFRDAAAHFLTASSRACGV